MTQNNMNIDAQLQQDCIVLGRFELCFLLLMKDANYPWFILVPDRPGVTEIFHLGPADRIQLLDESCRLAEGLVMAFKPDKLNIAAIGNIVNQLHVHHVARYKNDPAWPAPVWGKVPPIPYTDDNLESVINKLKTISLDGLQYFN